MNTIIRGEKIKALAVTFLDNQDSNSFFACQTGSTLMKINLINQPFKVIPYRTLFYVKGELKENPGTSLITVIVNFDLEDNRFISFNPEMIRLRPGLSVFDTLECLPDLSDQKPLPQREEYNQFNFFLLKRHSNSVRVIRNELECGNFGNCTPKYIKGSAYEMIFSDYKERVRSQFQNFKIVDPQKDSTKHKKQPTVEINRAMTIRKSGNKQVGHL